MADLWEAYVVDTDGFVLDKSIVEDVLSLLPDEDAIDRKYGDVIPESIEVCRGTARPKPQSPDSEILRASGSWQSKDKIELPLHDEEDPARALTLWRFAQAGAASLNAYEAIGFNVEEN